MDHPDRRQGHAEHQDIQALGIGELARFQIEAVAFPVAEGRLNPVAFAAPPPGLGIGRQIKRPIAGGVFRRRPIDEQVDWAKGPLLMQIDSLPIAAVATLEAQVAQRLPNTIASVKVQGRFESYLPMPVLAAA